MENVGTETPTFAELAAALPEDEKQYLIERAAVREFDGNLSRTEAEAGAVEDWLQRQRELSPGTKLSAILQGALA